MSVLGIGISSTAWLPCLRCFPACPLPLLWAAVAVVLHGHLTCRRHRWIPVTQNVYEGNGLDHAAVDPAVHPQGRRRSANPAPARDLYSALHAWLHRVPRRAFGVANVFALRAVRGNGRLLARDLPRAIGSAGIPEMRKARATTPGGFAAGNQSAAGGTLGILLAAPRSPYPVPPVAAEKSLGRLFPRRHRPRDCCW